MSEEGFVSAGGLIHDITKAEEQLEIREYLAKAMGWVHWEFQRWHPPGCNWYHTSLPDPFTSAEDLLKLVEWWISDTKRWIAVVSKVANNLIEVELDYLDNDRPFPRASGATLQEAFSLAVYQALKEVKDGRA